MDIATYTSGIQNRGTSLSATLDSSIMRQSLTSENAGHAQNNKLRTIEETETRNIDSQALRKKQQNLSKENREKMVQKLNEFIQSVSTGVAFRVDEELNRDIITIFELSTGKVIKQIPDEELLNILKSLKESASLLLEKV